MTDTKYIRFLIVLTFLCSVLVSLAIAQAQSPIDAGAVTAVIDAGPPAPVPLWTLDDPTTAATDDPIGFITEAIRAIKIGDYAYAAAFALILLTLGFRKLTKIVDKDKDGKDDAPTNALGKVRHWFNSSEEGGMASLLVVAFLTTDTFLLASHSGVSWSLLTLPLAAAVTAAGGYAAIFKFLLPLAKKIYGKIAG